MRYMNDLETRLCRDRLPAVFDRTGCEGNDFPVRFHAFPSDSILLAKFEKSGALLRVQSRFLRIHSCTCFGGGGR